MTPKVKIAAIATSGAVVLGLAIVAMLSGDQISFEGILGAVLTFIAGGAAGWLARRGKGTVGALMLCVVLSGSSGCAAFCGSSVRNIAHALDTAHDIAEVAVDASEDDRAGSVFGKVSIVVQSLLALVESYCDSLTEEPSEIP